MRIKRNYFLIKSIIQFQLLNNQLRFKNKNPGNKDITGYQQQGHK